MRQFTYLTIIVVAFLTVGCDHENKRPQTDDDLASWSDGIAKEAIVDFVSRTTTKGNADFIPVADRIAVFDNDGTLWCEQPLYFQLAFAIDRIKIMAPDHPEWRSQQPYKALLEGDLKTALAGGEHAILEIVMTTHAGMTTDEFTQTVKTWINTAKHPVSGRLYKEMTYKPMLELLEFLRTNGYKAARQSADYRGVAGAVRTPVCG